MTLSGLAFLWLVVAVGCVLAGTVLTRRRLVDSPPSPRAARRTTLVRKVSRKQSVALCVRCTQPLEVGARFCGSCGLYLEHESGERKIFSRPAK